MRFVIAGSIANAETIAAGHGIRELPRLRKQYGPGFWRKRKGEADIRLPDGSLRRAEPHWIRSQRHRQIRRQIKRYLD